MYSIILFAQQLGTKLRKYKSHFILLIGFDIMITHTKDNYFFFGGNIHLIFIKLPYILLFLLKLFYIF